MLGAIFAKELYSQIRKRFDRRSRLERARDNVTDYATRYGQEAKRKGQQVFSDTTAGQVAGAAAAAAGTALAVWAVDRIIKHERAKKAAGEPTLADTVKGWWGNVTDTVSSAASSVSSSLPDRISVAPRELSNTTPSDILDRIKDEAKELETATNGTA